MNVAIKAQQYQLALDIFAEMQAAGCQVRAGCALCFLFSSAVGVSVVEVAVPASSRHRCRVAGSRLPSEGNRPPISLAEYLLRVVESVRSAGLQQVAYLTTACGFRPRLKTLCYLPNPVVAHVQKHILPFSSPFLAAQPCDLQHPHRRVRQAQQVDRGGARREHDASPGECSHG